MFRQTLFLAVLAVLTLMASVAYSDTSSEIHKKTAIYGSAIDQKIAFYQSRLYLLDSEYKILSEIGRDASAKATYLTLNRGEIIKRMIAANTPLNCCKTRAFIGNCLCKNVVASAF